MIFNQLLISSLLFGLVMAKRYEDMSADEKQNAETVLIVCIVVGVLICISGSAAGGFFYMMRKRNSNNNNPGVMVVH
ncbi:hypothetical protein GCK72_019772 [Caenorhabditis remanei]|nr:hypothetical protein GCK72_019772 [Caenorhabditis remanei]KAF1753216.1 hypothetical protein GCK72_019772 [Caenorhabditis remanei]